MRCRRGAGPRGRRRGCTGEPRRSGGSREAWLESAPARPRDGPPARLPSARLPSAVPTRPRGRARQAQAAHRILRSSTVHRLASRAQRSHAGDHEHWTGLTTGYADRHQHTGAHCRPRRHEHAAQTRKPGPCASTDRTLSDLHSRLHTRCSGAGLGLAWYWHGIGMV